MHTLTKWGQHQCGYIPNIKNVWMHTLTKWGHQYGHLHNIKNHVKHPFTLFKQEKDLSTDALDTAKTHLF